MRDNFERDSLVLPSCFDPTTARLPFLQTVTSVKQFEKNALYGGVLQGNRIHLSGAVS
jgi:hypothetical protein